MKMPPKGLLAWHRTSLYAPVLLRVSQGTTWAATLLLLFCLIHFLRSLRLTTFSKGGLSGGKAHAIQVFNSISEWKT